MSVSSAAPLLAGAETWRLETHWTWAPWVTLLVVLGIIGVAVACYRYESSPAGVLYRATLAGLRLVTVALILAMLSEAVFSGSRDGKPRFTVLMDRSASMTRSDIGERGTTRLDAARGVLLDKEGALLRRLDRTYDLSVELIDGVTALAARGGDEAIAALADGAQSPEGDRTASRLGDHLAAAVESSAGATPQGLLLLTDGQVTAGRSLAEAAEAARRGGVPLYVVGLGSDKAPPEARLADLVADDAAFVDDLVAFRASLSTRGLAGRPVRVELFREGVATPVATETVTPGADDRPEGVEVRLVDRPTSPGEFRYTLRASPPPAGRDDEAATAAELTHTLRVRDDKVRVLLAAGYPGYEFRYLKQLLERDETVRVATFLQEADPEYVAEDLTATPQMPVRLEALAEFDVLVLVDLDPTLLPRSLWEEVGKFVSERGGGLVLAAGPRSLPVAYRGREAFAALAPTEVEKAATGGWHEPVGFAVLPTPLGRRSAAMELGDTSQETETIWRGLPPLYWRGDVGPPKPAAQVLAVHPGALLDGGGPAPLIASHYYGAGRVILHAIDGTYRWRFRVGDVYFARYWVQTLRSLARSKRPEGAASLEIASDRKRYEPGDPVRLRMRDERPGRIAATPQVVVLQSPGRPERRVELVAGGAGGRSEATVRDLAPGRYRAILADAGAPPVVAEFEVLAPLGEDARPELNRDGLRAAAERSRGAYLDYAEADRLGDMIPAGRPTAIEALPPYELWNRWPILAAITACLTLEWVLRKRRAML